MIRSTTLGSVRTAMIFISEPHVLHRSGSTSKTFRIRRAQLVRLEVDVVEDLSFVVSVQDAKHAVKAPWDKALRFRLA
jgi:hypothetical protein